MTMAIDGSTEAQARGRVGVVLKDKWRLDALLGIGGMAAVYSATHRNQKRVAIKMLLPELANDRAVRERFVREGYAANTIEHPGALSVLDDDVSDDGQPFLVMELLEGETVDARATRAGGRLEIPEVLAIAARVLDVLAAAHTKGVIHRDIKPENLFLLRNGALKVLDFGIARVLEGARGNQTSAGTVMGTPAFMAPEQALAKWDEVDGRTDLWALGATMFTLISGLHVHEGATGNEQFIKSATQQARSLATCVKGLPRSVVALVDRALKFDQSARWPDARAMQEAAAGVFESLTGTPLILEPPASSALDRPPRSVSGQFAGPGAAPTSPGASARRPVGDPVAPTLAAANSAVVRTVPSARGGPPPAPPARPGPPPAPPAKTASRPGAAPPPPARPGPPPPGRASGQFPGAPGSGPRPPIRSKQSSGSFDEVADASIMDPMASGGRVLAAPSFESLGVDAYIAGRNAERDGAVAEMARLQAGLADVQGRFAAVRRRVAQAQEQIAAARKERTAEEERFRRQTNARLEGVGEARKDYRRAMGEVARLALEDAHNFPASVGEQDRVAIKKASAMAEVKVKDHALHEAALASYDLNALKNGLAIGVTGVVLFLLLFFSPVIMRSCSSDTGTISPSGTP
ncbi:MAG TPA: serine/threonine-protein kinase [Polyangiaceae bacterium]|jgi:serine/threonine-protein kinase